MTKPNLRDTATERNLVVAYLTEASAYARYNFFATQADKEGYYPVGHIFRTTAANELRHCKVYFKMLKGGTVSVPISADAGIIGSTAENLLTAANEELTEGVDLYLAFAKTADAEGFPAIADHFRATASIEARHHARFLHLLKQLNEGTLWHRDIPIRWLCLVCGYVSEGTVPPAECPACDHPDRHCIGLDYDVI